MHQAEYATDHRQGQEEDDLALRLRIAVGKKQYVPDGSGDRSEEG